jgi:hypothetical protein
MAVSAVAAWALRSAAWAAWTSAERIGLLATLADVGDDAVEDDRAVRRLALPCAIVHPAHDAVHADEAVLEVGHDADLVVDKPALRAEDARRGRHGRQDDSD